MTKQLTPFPVARKCEAARENRYALHLLLDIDLPWNDDGTRHNRHVREVHFTRIREALEQRGWPYEIFHGSGAARQSSAFEIIRRL